MTGGPKYYQFGFDPAEDEARVAKLYGRKDGAMKPTKQVKQQEPRAILEQIEDVLRDAKVDGAVRLRVGVLVGKLVDATEVNRGG
jgi:hypothetical protein